MVNILVIEDEPSVAIAMRDSLESEGYSVEVASDGSAGFQKASAKPANFSLILLDLMLPKMSGLEICQRLRAAEIETPIIMLTARGASSDAAFGLKLGADDYIPKPFDVAELLARVEAVLRRSSPPQTEKQVVMIGDTMETDIRGAVEAGLHGFLVLTGSTQLENVCDYVYQPSRILQSVADLTEEILTGKAASHLGSRRSARPARTA